MNKPEKLSLIVGGSIIGGLALGFAGYKWYKSKQAAKMDIEALRNRYVGEEILDPNAKANDNNTENSDYDSALVFEDDDDDVSFTSSTGGGKKKKSRRQKKKKSKNNRKRHSNKRKKSKK